MNPTINDSFGSLFPGESRDPAEAKSCRQQIMHGF
jgi:hypothetical protein